MSLARSAVRARRSPLRSAAHRPRARRGSGRVFRRAILIFVLLPLFACADPAPAPAAAPVFPYTYTPETDLEPYEEVRFETQTWTPEDDPDQLALYLQKSVYHRPGAPEESLAHFAAMREAIPPLGAGVRVSFGGDAMWTEATPTVSASTAALFDGDVRVLNLETPTDPDQPDEPGALGLYAFNADPALLDVLPADLVQLNNNHSLDAGDAGLDATVAEVDARGLARTGVDAHARVGDVAFLSYTWGLNQFDAAPARELFVVPFGHLDEDIDLAGLQADVAAARAGGARSVVVLVHWGFEYEYYPDPHFLVLGRRIVAAGADLVVGQGPHVAQPVEVCAVNGGGEPGVGACAVETDDGVPRTAAIVYSLGNFVTGMATLPCQVGLVVTASLDPDVTGLGWSALATTPLGEVVPLDERVDDEDYAAEAERLAAHLGAGWRRGE